MAPAGFEPAVPASERPSTHAIDSAATGIGGMCCNEAIFIASRVKVEQVMTACTVNTDSENTVFILTSHPTPDRVTRRLRR
jgi:hypothetical protein